MMPEAARSCIVAIRQTIEVDGEEKPKEGMGFLVDDRHILTCAHVVSTTPHDEDSVCKRPEPERPVRVVFLLKGGYVESTALVTEWFAPENVPCPEEKDIAVLTLEKAKPEGATPAHIVGHERERGHFTVFGKLGEDYVPAHGIILERKLSDCFLVKRQRDDDYDFFIKQGYSGTPVWDEEAGGFVGMVVSALEEKPIASVISVDVLAAAWSYLSSIEARCLADNADVWNKKGNSLHSLGHYRKAITCYNKALEIDPDNAIVWNNKGNSYCGLGYYKKALTCYEQALEIVPDDADVWNNKGDSLKELGRDKAAEASYKQALEIDPEHQEARDSLRRLDEEADGGFKLGFHVGF